MKKFRRRTAELFVVVLGVSAALFSDGCREGAAKGVEVCARVLIPSLFPFMVLSNLAVSTGLCSAMGRRLERLAGALFRLPGAAAPVILLSLIGGYPVGARGIARLCEQGIITQREAKRAALFTVCAGPGFLINFVGAALYGSLAAGGILLGAQMISVLLIGCALRFFARGDENSKKEIKFAPQPFSSALVEASSDAAGGVTVMSALVVAFSAFTGMLSVYLPQSDVLLCLRTALEVSASLPELTKRLPLGFTAFFVGFGGVCVHFQIFAALGEVRVNKGLFFLMRIIQGLLTAALTQLAEAFFLREAEVFSTGAVSGAGLFGGSVIPAAALFVTAFAFLRSVRE